MDHLRPCGGRECRPHSLRSGPHALACVHSWSWTSLHALAWSCTSLILILILILH